MGNTGSNVAVTATTNQSTTTSQGTPSGTIQATFSSVTQSGTFTDNFYESGSTSDIAQSIGATPASQINFQLAGEVPQLWDVNFSGQFNGSTTLVFSYDPNALGGRRSQHALHRALQNGQWVVPPGQVVNTSNDTITVQVTGFSPFALGAKTVPEPSTFVLLAAGAIGFVGYRRRRRSAKAWRPRETVMCIGTLVNP